MVARKNLKSNALISVYDKSSLKQLCSALTKFKIGIISTGETAKKIKSLGFKCQDVSNLTGFREILDGRVKTLHPKIHASILFKRNNINHKKTFMRLNFPQIDFLIVNFYPFSIISNKKTNIKKIEMIDIGGPSMVRSASKNFKYVTTICQKKYYKLLVKELEINNGKTTLAFRRAMAENNFKLTSDYDLSIFKWFNKNNEKKEINKIKIKYGENPNQKAYFIKESKSNIFNSQLSGKEMGYNNILDISEGLSCLREFQEPTCIILKHNNPCGVASAKNIKNAFKKAVQSDPISAFGGVLLLNRRIDIDLAKKINRNFFEVLVAPKINKNVLNKLKSKKKLIIIDSSKIKENKIESYKSVISGSLHQEIDLEKINKSKIKLIANNKKSERVIDDLLFAFKVAKHVKSNAIVLAKNKQTVGIGAGQMSRLDATRMAILKYKDFFKDKKFVCASDAFFPFTDNLKLLLRYNCTDIIQPSGSRNDLKIINFAKNNKISLYFIKNRVFKH